MAESTSPFNVTNLQIYQQAVSLAQRANEAANTARQELREWQEEKFRLDTWNRIMSNTHSVIWCLIFIIVCVCEYMFSRDLYRDFLPQASFVPAVGLIALSVLVSHFISTKFSSHLFNLELFELSTQERNKDRVEMDIKAELKSEVNRNFIIGSVLFVILGSLIFYLSQNRVLREIAAGRRSGSFGVQDLLPVIFYVFEVLSGIFIVYFFRHLKLSLKVKNLYKSKENYMQFCRIHTQESVAKFEQALGQGFDIQKNDVAEDLRVILWRHDSLVDEEKLIQEPEKKMLTAIFTIKNQDGTPVIANARITTKYCYADTNATDNNGNITFKKETFEGDTVKELEINGRKMAGPYQMGDNSCTHTIIL